ncbi:hypothetical protein TWF506_001732 [Arthrobotrys conoides]|uniref:Uncharacterized protein n=1 Tax=Arthrobotrys conoides TaxID=74498 RepID=A0AAN8RRI7_9PEZI
MNFSTPWLIRTLLIFIVTSQPYLASAQLSPFYKASFDAVKTNIPLRNALKSLEAKVSTKDPSLATTNPWVCTVRPLESNTRELSKGIASPWQKESTCPTRDYLLSLILDAYTTKPSDLQKIVNEQGETTVSTEVCKPNKFGPILAAILSLVSEQKLKDCKFVGTNREGLATWEEYKTFIAELDKSMLDAYDTINGWICKHEMTDRSLTYFTLFLRTPENSRYKDLSERNSGINGPVTLHFLEDYPVRLETTLKRFTKDIGEDAEELIQKLLVRAQITKGVMRTFGKKNKSKKEKNNLKKYCEAFKNSIPASA